jgi:hypothetical protein
MRACLATFVTLGLLIVRVAADEPLHLYEGDVLPHNPSEGWLVYDACKGMCTESNSRGHLVFHWPSPNNLVNYH